MLLAQVHGSGGVLSSHGSDLSIAFLDKGLTMAPCPITVHIKVAKMTASTTIYFIVVVFTKKKMEVRMTLLIFCVYKNFFVSFCLCIYKREKNILLIRF